MKFKPDGFIAAMAIVILMARLFPSWSGLLPFDNITSTGISLIFFFYGLKLSPEKLRNDLSNTRLHLLIQGTTFILFPLLILATATLTSQSFSDPLWLGLMFLAALPSTVSTSVVMVSLAKGNVPAAIFNASISGLIGIVITPLWMSFVMKSGGHPADFSSIYMKLITEVVFPVALGMLFHRIAGKFAVRYAKQMTLFDRTIILLIIFKSFAHAFQERLFDTVSTQHLFVITLLVISLFFLVYYLTGRMSRMLHFTREDEITTRYCGTKKSLVHGTVFSGILFGTASTGLILLPLMIFHAFQILYISAVAAREGNKIHITTQ